MENFLSLDRKIKKLRFLIGKMEAKFKFLRDILMQFMQWNLAKMGKWWHQLLRIILLGFGIFLMEGKFKNFLDIWIGSLQFVLAKMEVKLFRDRLIKV